MIARLLGYAIVAAGLGASAPVRAQDAVASPLRFLLPEEARP
ncbi:hypothetical protein [Sphingobium sp. CCH11-B1]|jgi:hypothetical protein|nr:hypothetical protein [Sphingobium sp. CCH11-B1]MEA3391170.1 hypothetical protein [Pseudomonadota bacterium]